MTEQTGEWDEAQTMKEEKKNLQEGMCRARSPRPNRECKRAEKGEEEGE